MGCSCASSSARKHLVWRQGTPAVSKKKAQKSTKHHNEPASVCAFFSGAANGSSNNSPQSPLGQRKPCLAAARKLFPKLITDLKRGESRKNHFWPKMHTDMWDTTSHHIIDKRTMWLLNYRTWFASKIKGKLEARNKSRAFGRWSPERAHWSWTCCRKICTHVIVTNSGFRAESDTLHSNIRVSAMFWPCVGHVPVMSQSCTCHNATVSRSCLGHVLITVMSPLARGSWSCDCCVTVLSCSTHVPVTWLPSLRLEMAPHPICSLKSVPVCLGHVPHKLYCSM